MYKSSLENVKPEQKPINDSTADNLHVSPAIGNTNVMRRCPLCDGEPMLITRGNEHTKKRSAEIECIGCHIKLIVGAIRNSLEWCKTKVLEKWNSRPEKKFEISKELFISTIEKIKQQYDYDIQCADKLKDIFPNAFKANLMYENHLIMNQLVELLQITFNDNHAHSWIEYFMWELDFGIKNDKYKATDRDGNNIPLSTASELYDCLTNGA